MSIGGGEGGGEYFGRRGGEGGGRKSGIDEDGQKEIPRKGLVSYQNEQRS